MECGPHFPRAKVLGDLRGRRGCRKRTQQLQWPPTPPRCLCGSVYGSTNPRLPVGTLRDPQPLRGHASRPTDAPSDWSSSQVRGGLKVGSSERASTVHNEDRKVVGSTHLGFPDTGLSATQSVRRRLPSVAEKMEGDKEESTPLFLPERSRPVFPLSERLLGNR